MMRDDQLIRGVAIVASAFVYVARLALHGNGPVGFIGYEANAFALTLAAFVVLALPETIDRLPYFKNRTE